MEIIFKIGYIIVCGLLFWLGGRSWGHKAFRRIGIPVLLSLYCAIHFKWWLFFLVGACLGLTIPIGYGAYDPEYDDKPSFLASITHDSQGWLIRGLYGLIVALSSTWLLLCYGFIDLWAYLGYLALNLGIGAGLCAVKAESWTIEPLVGMGIASIVLL